MREAASEELSSVGGGAVGGSLTVGGVVWEVGGGVVGGVGGAAGRL